MPSDRHDFLHGELDVILDLNNGFFPMAEWELVVYLVSPDCFPDKVSLLIFISFPISA